MLPIHQGQNKVEKMKKLVLRFICFMWVGYSCYAGIPQNLCRPADSTRSIIGISVFQRAPVTIVKNKSQKVVFLKIRDSSGREDPRVILSNYSSDDRVYLVNAEPGKYAVIAAYYQAGAHRGLTFFSEEAFKISEIDVNPRQFVFIGKFVMDNFTELAAKGDGTQKDNFSRLNRIRDREEIEELFSADIYRGTLNKYDRIDRSLEEILLKAKNDFKKTGWMEMLNNE